MSHTESYDELPHPSVPRPETQPDRLAAIATLFGLTPAPPERGRVLDLGCSDGGNLISTALAYPECELVGVDLSPVQIEQGRARVSELGLENVRLEVGDLLDLPQLGTFDYVVSYGIASWVPDPVRAALLRAIKASLAPQGIAYVNYNTYPGWHFLGSIREMMLYRSDPHDMRARIAQARGVLQFLAASVPESAAIYRAFLQDEWKDLLHLSDHSLRWDYLSDVHHPFYFHEFVAEAGEHGLQHVADANFASTLPANSLRPEALEKLNALAPDLVAREQYTDFLVNRSFRRSVLCHAEVPLQRKLAASRLETLHVASGAGPQEPVADDDLRSDAKVEFHGPKGGTLGSKHPLSKGALAYLAERWPTWVPVGELVDRARAWYENHGGAPPAGPHDGPILNEHLLVAFSRGMIELHAAPPCFVREAGERPCASPLARLRVAGGEPAVNLRHELVALDPNATALLPLLDGSRDRAALLSALPEWDADGLAASLGELAESALLVS